MPTEFRTVLVLDEKLHEVQSGFPYPLPYSQRSSTMQSFEERLKRAYDCYSSAITNASDSVVNSAYTSALKALSAAMVKINPVATFTPKPDWVRVETTRCGCSTVEYYHPDFPEKLIEEMNAVARSLVCSHPFVILWSPNDSMEDHVCQTLHQSHQKQRTR